MSKESLVRDVMMDAQDMSDGEVRLYKPHAKEQHITIEKIKKYLPKGTNAKITAELVDKLNSIDEEGFDKDIFHEKLLSYMHLIGPGISVEKLMNAIKWVTLLSFPRMTMEKAYGIVFPYKYKEITERGQDCSSFATMYNQSKAVTEVQRLTIMAASITERPMYYRGLRKLQDLSNGIGASPDDYVSPKVQLDATLGYMDIVKPPEESVLTIKQEESEQTKSFQESLLENLKASVAMQREALKSGKKLKDVQRIGLRTDGSVNGKDEEIIDVG